MQIKNYALSAIVIIILTGLLTFILSSAKINEHQRTQIDREINIDVVDKYEAGTIPKTTIMLLLAVGVIGLLGISRKRKADIKFNQNHKVNEAEPAEN